MDLEEMKEVSRDWRWFEEEVYQPTRLSGWDELVNCKLVRNLTVKISFWGSRTSLSAVWQCSALRSQNLYNFLILALFKHFDQFFLSQTICLVFRLLPHSFKVQRQFSCLDNELTGVAKFLVSGRHGAYLIFKPAFYNQQTQARFRLLLLSIFVLHLCSKRREKTFAKC